MARRPVNRFNLVIGAVGFAYVLLFARYFYLSSGREHPGNAGISFLALVVSLVPALGLRFGLARPQRSFVGWRAVALVLCGLLLGPLWLLWSYEH